MTRAEIDALLDGPAPEVASTARSSVLFIAWLAANDRDALAEAVSAVDDHEAEELISAAFTGDPDE